MQQDLRDSKVWRLFSMESIAEQQQQGNTHLIGQVTDHWTGLNLSITGPGPLSHPYITALTAGGVKPDCHWCVWFTAFTDVDGVWVCSWMFVSLGQSWTALSVYRANVAGVCMNNVAPRRIWKTKGSVVDTSQMTLIYSAMGKNCYVLTPLSCSLCLKHTCSAVWWYI